MGDHVYFNKHSSAAKGISCHTKHQFMDMGATQARPNNRAYAGPRTAQVTATQWLIFLKIPPILIHVLRYPKHMFSLMRDIQTVL